MLQGTMVLTKGARVGNLFYVFACTIECNNSSISTIDICIISTPSQSSPPKQVLASKRKFHIENTILWHQLLGHIGEKGL